MNLHLSHLLSTRKVSYTCSHTSELTEIESKFAAINLIVATLYHITCFGHDNFDTLVSNSLQYCGKLLKKPSQCEATTIASSLYYSYFLVCCSILTLPRKTETR